MSGSSGAEQMAHIREEIRFELSLLHDRVSALLAAEAFLTIAFTAAMGTSARWGEVVAPVLSVLGLALAVLAWPGVRGTVRIILGWTARRTELLRRDPTLSSTVWALSSADRAARADQWRSMLFFRAVPGLFGLVWTGLTVVAVVLRR